MKKRLNAKYRNAIYLFAFILSVFVSCPTGSVYANVDCCIQEEVCSYSDYPFDYVELYCCRNTNIKCTWIKTLWCQDFNMVSVSSCPELVTPCWQQNSTRVIYQNQYGHVVARIAWRYQRVNTTCDPAPPVSPDPEFQWFRHTNSNCYTSLCNNDICPCKP